MEWLVDVHSVWRWVVVLVALGALVLAVMSATGSRPWDSTSDRLSFFFTLAMDIQFLIGAVLWIAQSRWTGGDAFLSFVHPLLMLAAVALAHIGRTRAERATGDRDKGRQAAIFFGASLLVVLLAIPIAAWPL